MLQLRRFCTTTPNPPCCSVMIYMLQRVHFLVAIFLDHAVVICYVTVCNIAQ